MFIHKGVVGLGLTMKLLLHGFGSFDGKTVTAKSKPRPPSGREYPRRKGIVSTELDWSRYALAKEPQWLELQLAWPCGRILTDLSH